MTTASRRLAEKILLALGITTCIQTAGCPFIGGCPTPPERHAPPHPEDAAPGHACWVSVEGDDEASEECVALSNFSGSCPDASDPAVATAITDEYNFSGESIDVRDVVCFAEQKADPTNGDQCCYGVVHGPIFYQCVGGRPFVMAGEARVAPLCASADWLPRAARAASVGQVSALAAETLAASWAEDALYEHASIASFARFVLELLAVGAPADLVRDAQRALADEIAHAEICFALASRYAGKPLGAGALPMHGAALERTSLAEIAAAAAQEGCIGETVSALIAQAASERAEDPEAKRALKRIFTEETRHAELSFRFVAWAIERGGEEVRSAVAAALGNAPGVAEQAWHPKVEDELRAHGRLSPSERRAIAAAAYAEVVVPCAAAMLQRGTTALRAATAVERGVATAQT